MCQGGAWDEQKLVLSLPGNTLQTLHMSIECSRISQIKCNAQSAQAGHPAMGLRAKGWHPSCQQHSTNMLIIEADVLFS